ncbi:ATP-dependent zinc metalloprotease FtsH [Bienertia sinuspersici]
MYKRDKVMPGLLDVYKETHLTSDKLPDTQMANDALRGSIENHIFAKLALHCCVASLYFVAVLVLLLQVWCCYRKSSAAASLSMNEMKRLLEQRKAGEISLTDEEIYAKIKPKGKRNIRDRPDKAMNEAAEAKNEAIGANEQNKILTKKLKNVERENKVTRHYLEKFLNTLGYKLSEFNMDEGFEESNEEYDNEEDKDEEEISGNDLRHE